jgi:hypothetical protein
LFLVQALADGAFEKPYTVEEFLTRQFPDSNRNYETAAWKPEFLDKKIVKVSYSELDAIWNRVVLVAGLPDKLRLYSLRVGSANRLNGKLTSY